MESWILVASALLLLSASIPAADAQFRKLPQSDVKPLVGDLVSRGFSICAAVVQPVQGLIPAHSTLLLPTNDAIANVDANLSQQDILRTLQYHVITFPTSFRALSRKPVGSELPTLLRGAVLRVTSNSPGNFAINGVRVTQPDVCRSTSSVACHGVDSVILFNSSLAAAGSPPLGTPVGEPGTVAGAPDEAVEGPGTVEIGAPTAGETKNARFNTTITSDSPVISASWSTLGVLLAWLLT